jgi:hypothetical protein
VVVLAGKRVAGPRLVHRESRTAICGGVGHGEPRQLGRFGGERDRARPQGPAAETAEAGALDRAP